MATLEVFVNMNPASGVIELSKGFLGSKLSSRSRHKTLGPGRAKFSSISCSDARGRRGAVAVGKNTTKLGQVDSGNGFPTLEETGSSNDTPANGAAKAASGIRNTIFQEPRNNVSVYDLDPPGPRSVHNYMEQVTYFLTDDGGPPRWFSPVTPAPPADAPTLFFLPGMDGTGLGLMLHYESLGRLFNMQCLHIPVRDRTPFSGLLKIAEETVLAEHARRPNSPIYLIGDSFGGSLSLAVAARNPTLDLILILANPATSFDRSQLQPLFPLLQAASPQLFSVVPYLLSFIMGDPIKMAEGRVKIDAPPLERAQQLRESLLSLLPTLPTLAEIVPKDALLWKLKLLHSAALFTNSRLHAVRAQVLILASGKDGMLPSAEEAKRLKKILPNCRTRYFKDSGHTLLLPLFPLLQAASPQLFSVVPYLLSFIMGDPMKMAEGRVKIDAPPSERAQQLRESLLSLLPTLPTLAEIVPKDALLWKLKLLHSAALFTNSRLHAVRAQVLILASGKDGMLPSAEEAKRLKKILPSCRTRYFKDSGHTLLLEGGLNLATVIQGAGMYRRGRTQDIVTDFVVPTLDDFDAAYEKNMKLIWQTLSPVFFSTSANGEVEQGFQNIPNDRPVLFVGNHMYYGLDMTVLVYKVFKERGLIIRALGHPIMFDTKMEQDLQEASTPDLFRAFGAVPVTGGKLMFKLLKMGYSTLLYPGGAREALHRKGEVHKLFWPKRSEFVRMAARFGCTIVPVSTAGEDEIINIIFDLNDVRRIPNLEEKVSLPGVNLRGDLNEEVADQPIHFPFAAPSLTPGRIYVKFGKPIVTAGREKELQRDKEQAQAVYKHVQGEVERGIEYLLWKRQEDPYREFGPRILYEQFGQGDRQAPTFTV